MLEQELIAIAKDYGQSENDALDSMMVRIRFKTPQIAALWALTSTTAGSVVIDEEAMHRAIAFQRMALQTAELPAQMAGISDQGRLQAAALAAIRKRGKQGATTSDLYRAPGTARADHQAHARRDRGELDRGRCDCDLHRAHSR